MRGGALVVHMYLTCYLVACHGLSVIHGSFPLCCAQGWNWVDEGRDGRHKYGYVTEEANHDITFVVSRAAVHYCKILLLLLLHCDQDDQPPAQLL